MNLPRMRELLAHTPVLTKPFRGLPPQILTRFHTVQSQFGRFTLVDELGSAPRIHVECSCAHKENPMVTSEADHAELSNLYHPAHLDAGAADFLVASPWLFGSYRICFLRLRLTMWMIVRADDGAVLARFSSKPKALAAVLRFESDGRRYEVVAAPSPEERASQVESWFACVAIKLRSRARSGDVLIRGHPNAQEE
jgi:hypothetical protein